MFSAIHLTQPQRKLLDNAKTVRLHELAQAALRYRQVLDLMPHMGGLVDGMTADEHQQKFIDEVDRITG